MVCVLWFITLDVFLKEIIFTTTPYIFLLTKRQYIYDPGTSGWTDRMVATLHTCEGTNNKNSLVKCFITNKQNYICN